MNKLARHSTKNRSRDQVARLMFVSCQANNRIMNKVVYSTAQHFSVACDFAIFRNTAIRNGRFNSMSLLKGEGR